MSLFVLVFVTSGGASRPAGEVTNTNTNKLNFKPAGEVTNTNTNKLNFRDFPYFGSGRRLPALFVILFHISLFRGRLVPTGAPADTLLRLGLT